MKCVRDLVLLWSDFKDENCLIRFGFFFLLLPQIPIMATLFVSAMHDWMVR